jgi:delta24-sterol reductase
VAAISANVQRFYEDKILFRIFYGSSNSTRVANRQENVNISALNNLISIDKVKKVVIVEPGIAMDDLAKRLIPLNLMPAVVPEFPGITAGGAFAGTAAESSSFRHGYFDSAVNEVEMVLGNGDVVFASPTSNADLFYEVLARWARWESRRCWRSNSSTAHLSRKYNITT